MTPEVLKEANRQAVLTLMKVEKETSPDFYLMHAQTLVNNVRIDYEHAEAHRMMMKAEIPYVIIKGLMNVIWHITGELMVQFLHGRCTGSRMEFQMVRWVLAFRDI